MTAHYDPAHYDTALARWASTQARTVGRSGIPDDGRRQTTAQTPVRVLGPLPEIAFRPDRPLAGHIGWVWSVAWATLPDGRLLLATGSDDGTARIWDPHIGTSLHALTDHTTTVYSVAWATLPDGRLLLATGGTDGTARIWDPHTGTSLHTLTGHTTWVRSVAWATLPDGRLLLATGSTDRTARIWDPHTGTCLHTLTDHTTTVWSVAWATLPDGRLLLATGGTDGTARIWDPHTGTCLHTLTDHNDTVASVAWATLPDGRPLLATASRDRTARIWDPHTGTCLHTLTDHTDMVRSVAWGRLPDGRLLLATGSYDDTARIWDPHTGTCLAVLDHPADVNTVDFATFPDGRLVLATGCDDTQAHLWSTDLTQLAPGREPSPAWTGPVARDPKALSEITFRPDRPLVGQTGMDWSVAWGRLPEGRVLLATGSSDSTARIWDPQTGTCLHSLTDHTNTVRSVAWATLPDGRPLLATASDDGTARIWDPHTATSLNTLTGHTSAVRSVAWGRLPDGHLLLATGSDDGTARIWDPHTGTSLHTLTDHISAVVSVAWGTLADGRLLLATGSTDHTARIWDPHTATSLNTLTGHTNTVYSVAWATLPDGRPLLATGSADKTVRIWDPHTGTCLHTLTDHTNTVWSVTWATLPDGRLLLATGSADKTVRIWDPHTGTCLTVLDHPNVIVAVDFATFPDERLTLATSCRGAHLWSADVALFAPIEPPGASPAHPDQDSSTPAPLPAANEMLLLGAAGMWLPLGLLSDLITLTGPTRPATVLKLHDSRLRVLADHPGIGRLRDLNWPPAARTAFAALLSATQPTDASYQPPEDTTPHQHRDALDAALRSPPTPATTIADVAHLRTAADAIGPGTIALLAILGPQAATLDPLLALRLAHHTPQLPELSPAQHTLLAATPTASPPSPRASTSATARAPGTTGITRHGTPTTLLHTQLALPEPLFSLRYATHELLHRHHPATTTAPARALTLILDTTPPTYGPCETLLRLVTHLITTTLWHTGHHPVLITLTDPHRTRLLTSPPDLVALWTSRTLNPPDLPAALHTATTTSTNPTLTLTTHHSARDHPKPSAERQLLTTHNPTTPPARIPGTPYHHHLDPRATQTALATTVRAILTNTTNPERRAQ